MFHHAPGPGAGSRARLTDPEPCTPRAARWVLAASTLGSSMAFIDGSVVSVALPVLQRDLGASVAAAQWIVEAYALFLASLVLVGGAMADRYGRRRIFAAGTVVFSAASLGCAVAPSTAVLVAARALQGIGASLLVPSSLALLGAAFTPETRGRAVGTWSALTSLATAIGPALGGWLVQAISWRAVFVVNLPIGATVLWIAARRVPETRQRAARRVDAAGGALATAGLGALVFGLIEAPTAGIASPRFWAAVGGGVVLLFAFVAHEHRTREPMLPLSLFRHRTFAAANALTLFLYTGLAGLFFILPFVLIQARGQTPAAAGAALLPLVVIVASLSRASGALADRLGPRIPLTLGPVICAAGFALAAVLAPHRSYAASLLPALVVLGLGLAATIAPLTTSILNSVEAKQQGTASGISNAIARLATLFAIALIGIVGSATFNRALDRRLDADRISAAVRRRLDPQRPMLGAMKPPGEASPAERRSIDEGIADGLEATFRAVALGGAGLAIVGAACGAMSGTAASRSGKPSRPS